MAVREAEHSFRHSSIDSLIPSWIGTSTHMLSFTLTLSYIKAHPSSLTHLLRLSLSRSNVPTRPHSLRHLGSFSCPFILGFTVLCTFALKYIRSPSLRNTLNFYMCSHSHTSTHTPPAHTPRTAPHSFIYTGLSSLSLSPLSLKHIASPSHR